MLPCPLPALVLTAGLGTRLDPLTRLVAKGAVPLGRRTLVEHVLDWLREQQVSDVLLNLHHRPETITTVLGDGAHLGMRVRYSWEDPILGSAGGPKRALSLIATNRLLIVNGDTLCRIDLPPMLAAHARSGAEVTLALIRNPAPGRYNGVVLDEDDRVRAFVPKDPANTGTWHFIGVQIADARAFAALPPNEPAEATTGLYRRLIADRPGSVRGWRVDAPFLDVGTPRNYLDAALALSGAAPGPDGVSRSVIWPEARVAPDAVLDECIVAGRITVPARFRAARSVLVPASTLRPDERVPIAGDAAVFPLDDGVGS